MHPGRTDRTDRVGRTGQSRSGRGGSAVEVERSHSRWSRGVRPLRRSEGVPSPLETPGFLYRSELCSLRARNRTLAVTLGLLVGVASVLALGLRVLLS